MAFIYKRGRRLWCRVKVNGRWESAPTPYNVGDEAKARRFATATQKDVDARKAGAADGPATVNRYAERWLAERREKHEATRRRYEATGQGKVQHRDHATDESRMRRHVLPHLGDLLLSEARPKHLADWIHKLRTSTALSAKTVRNIYGLASALFRDAAVAGLVESTPCILTDAQLGEEDELGDGAGRYTREDFERMIGSDELPEIERMFAALGGLGGVRLGAIAGFRWGDLDASTEPMWRLTSSRTYDRRPTKTGRVSAIPVHPVLAEMLTSWRHGWAEMFGRAPTAEDPIVPRPPGKWRDKPGAPHTKKTGGDLMDRILAALEITPAPKKAHALRSTFISIALEDGADDRLIRRITHPAGKGRDAFARYDRADYWPQLCAEVGKIRITPKSGGRVVKLVTGHVTGSEKQRIYDALEVEAPGVEVGADVIPIRSGARKRRVTGVETAPSAQERTSTVTCRVTALREASDDLDREADALAGLVRGQGVAP